MFSLTSNQNEFIRSLKIYTVSRGYDNSGIQSLPIEVYRPLIKEDEKFAPSCLCTIVDIFKMHIINLGVCLTREKKIMNNF